MQTALQLRGIKLGAPRLTTWSKKLLGAPGIATRSKDATRLETDWVYKN